MMGLLRKIWKIIHNTRINYFNNKLKYDSGLEFTRIGTVYGGWTVPRHILRPGGVALCVGAGEDISLEVGLNARHGMFVYSIDPTPRARVHVEQCLSAFRTGRKMSINNDPDHTYEANEFDMERFVFVPKGIWSENCRKRFYTPQNPESVSHSIVNLQNTESYFEAECVSLKTLLESLRIGRPDLIKIDVEGAEYEVLRSALNDDVRAGVYCVEFDEGQTKPSGYLRRIKEICCDMKNAGYLLCHIEGWNYCFVDRNLI